MPLEIDLLRDPQAYVQLRLSADELPLGAERQTGSFTARALELAQLTTSVLGAQRAAPITFLADQAVSSDELGARSVFLYQHVEGIHVLQAEQVVGFGPNGQADFTHARLFSGEGEPDYRLTVSSEAAVTIAAAHVGASEFNNPEGSAGPVVDLVGFSPALYATFSDLAELPTVFEAGPFSDAIRAALVWVPIGKVLRLGWNVHLTLPPSVGAFQVIVAADTGDILFATQLMLFAVTGNVFQTNPATPREAVNFSRQWGDYDLDPTPDLPPEPSEWVSADATEGTTCKVYFADTHLPVKSTPVGGDATFDPQDAMCPFTGS